MVTKIIGLLFATLCVSAHACSGSQNLPGQSIDVVFTKNSSAMNGLELLKLANWAADMKLEFPIHDGLYIGGLAEASENSPVKLAANRAEEVKLALVQFGLVRAPIHISSRIYKPLAPNDIDQNGRRVEVELSPGCPDSCCDSR